MSETEPELVGPNLPNCGIDTDGVNLGDTNLFSAGNLISLAGLCPAAERITLRHRLPQNQLVNALLTTMY